MIVHRILSYFLLLIIVPVWISIGVLAFIWQLANGFSYHKFWFETDVPESAYDVYGRGGKTEVLGRISVILVAACYDFVDHLKCLKSLRLP